MNGVTDTSLETFNVEDISDLVYVDSSSLDSGGSNISSSSAFRPKESLPDIKVRVRQANKSLNVHKLVSEGRMQEIKEEDITESDIATRLKLVRQRQQLIHSLANRLAQEL